MFLFVVCFFISRKKRVQAKVQKGAGQSEAVWAMRDGKLTHTTAAMSCWSVLQHYVQKAVGTEEGGSC